MHDFAGGSEKVGEGKNLGGAFDPLGRTFQHELIFGENDGHFRAVVPDQLGRAAARNNFTVVHYGNFIAKILRLFHVVSGQNDGFTFFFYLLNKIPQVSSRLGIQTGRRFIRNQ
jgi:hypothetical protein